MYGIKETILPTYNVLFSDQFPICCNILCDTMATMQ